MSASFKIEADQVPNFSRYEVYLEAGASTRCYFGTDAVSLPSLKTPDRAGKFDDIVGPLIAADRGV